MITITQNKVAGFEPRWARFLGFSVLFDNPGASTSRYEGLLNIMCAPELDGDLDLYFRLAKTISDIGRDLLTTTFLFCPLPPSSYHVTVWDGINVGNESQLPESLGMEWSPFLRGIPKTLHSPPATMRVVEDSSLLNTNFRDIVFRFDQLAIWVDEVLVARLAPVDEASAQRLHEISEARALLAKWAKSEFGINTFPEYSPHVSLGYFANREHGQLAHPHLGDWTERFRKNLANSVLTFSSMAVYGFTDMARYYKKDT